MATRYLHVSIGLRGCYMPDSSYVARVTTRRALRELIADEASRWKDAGAQGLSDRAQAQFCAEVWRRKLPGLPLCLPIKPQGAGSHSSGIFISDATRADFLEQETEQ